MRPLSYKSTTHHTIGRILLPVLPTASILFRLRDTYIRSIMWVHMKIILPWIAKTKPNKKNKKKISVSIETSSICFFPPRNDISLLAAQSFKGGTFVVLCIRSCHTEHTIYSNRKENHALFPLSVIFVPAVLKTKTWNSFCVCNFWAQQFLHCARIT